MASVVSSARLDAEFGEQPLWEWRCIGWLCPPTGWVKLNMYGALKGNLGLAGAGRILRNEDGTRFSRVVRNIGVA